MRPNLRIISKKVQRGRGRRSSKSCENYEKMMKTLLLQNQQIIIQQQNMMFMVMKQFQPQSLDQTTPVGATATPQANELQPNDVGINIHGLVHTHQYHQHTQSNQGVVNQASSQQQSHVLQPLHVSQQQLVEAQQHSFVTETNQQSAIVASGPHTPCPTSTNSNNSAMASQQQHNANNMIQHHHHHDENSMQSHHLNHQPQQGQLHHHQQTHLSFTPHQMNGQQQQAQRSQSSDNNQQIQQVATPAHLQAENIATAYLTPVASEQDPISDSKPDDDDISALLSGDDLLTGNLLYNPQTDIGQVTPYKGDQQHNQTPSYYSSGCESLTTPRVEQQQARPPTTTNISQNVVKNLADSFKSPSKPKINVQILTNTATRNMKNNKAKIIQRMNISEFLRQVHHDDQAHQKPVKSSATQ